MKGKFLHKTLCGLSGLLLTIPLAAQNTNKFTFDIGGGFTEPVQHNDGREDMGFNVTAGAGYNFIPYLGVKAEFGYNRNDLSNTLLNQVGVPGGNGHIYSVTLEPIVHFHPKGRADAYLIGGGGFYHRTIEFTQPSVGFVNVFDPFFGTIYPVAVPATQVLASFTQNKGGLNIGGGVEFRIKGDSNAKIFAEARYHYIYTTPVRTTILPVTFGFRW